MRYRIGLPSWFSGKESVCNAEDLGSISGLERPPRGGNGNLLQYSCLENPMDRGAWRAIVHEVAESDTTEVTEQMRYRLEQGGFCSSKTHSVNTYLWVDLVEDQMPLFWPDGPQIHPLVLCLLSTPPLLLSSLGLIPEGARISQAPMSASFAWVRQRGRQQETGGKK